MRRGAIFVVSLIASTLPGGDTAARGTLRLGYVPLALESSPDTPVFGDDVDRAVERYNAAASAHDRTSGDTTAKIDASDLALDATLLVIAPGVETGRGLYFFRLEVPIGLADGLTSVGVAVYPLNLQAAFGRGVVAYVSAGGSASWLDRPGSGDIGGLLAARGAAGVRLANRLVVEIGYNAFALGGSYDSEGIATMMSASGTMTAPSDAIAAGEARGLVDASLGVTF